MPPAASRWARWASLVLIALLAAAVLASSEWSYRAADSALREVDAGHHARVTTQRLLRRLVDAESAQRGYLLTGRPEYLVPYRDADADVARDLAQIRPHYERDARLRPHVQALAARAEEKLSELSTTLAAYEAGRQEAWQALLASDIGRERMEAARQAASVLLREEAARIETDRELVDRVLARGRLGVLAALLLAAAWLVIYVRQHDALQAAHGEHAGALQRERDALERQVRARTEELRALNAYLQEVRESERGQLARLLHDELGALLTAAKLDIARLRRTLGAMPQDAAARLSHLGSAIDEGVALKRRIIEELSPSALHTLGLKPALEILAAEVRQRSGIAVALDCDDVEPPPQQCIAIYRLVQEGLRNVERHAATQAAQVTVRAVPDGVRVAVSDAGSGFEPGTVGAAAHGLRTLRHRIESLGGHLEIDSAPGRGTRLQVVLPGPARSGTAIAPDAPGAAAAPPP